MEPRAHNQRFTWPTGLRTSACIALYLLLATLPLKGYSVLSHEALIDAAWKPYIVPLLLQRFPGATLEELQEAHAYAYGGSVIQDMGYYPFGDKFFSKLTHYVRSGDFVEALLKDSRNINEYAFALGALSHYVADRTGHPLAVNVSVPLMYPRLRRKYGNRVTYEDDPTAHIMTEFSFDVVQITGAGYLPKSYHNYIGFKVPRALLGKAFRQTYGLKLSKLFLSERLSLWMYKLSASEIIPQLSRVVWHHKRRKFRHIDPQIVTTRFAYELSRQNYESGTGKHRKFNPLRPWTWHWKAAVKQENIRFISKVLVLVVEVMPKVGPLRTLQFRPPTVEVQNLFIKAFDVSVSRFESDVSELSGSGLELQDDNLDTGRPTRAGRYFLADQTYSRLLNDLAKHGFRGVPPELRENMLAFYGNHKAPAVTKDHMRKWRRTLRELSALRSTPVQIQAAAHYNDKDGK